MGKNNTKTPVTEKIFGAVKILLAGGATYAECADYMNIGKTTVYYIKQAETFEEYKAITLEKKRAQVAAMKAKVANPAPAQPAPVEVKPENTSPVQVVEHRQTVTVQATWQMTQEMQRTNKLLEQISNKLAFIVDELCGVKPPKEG